MPPVGASITQYPLRGGILKPPALRVVVDLGHQRLPRELVAAEQTRQALGLIMGWRKDAGAHRAVLGFADKQTAQQVGKTVKDFCPHQGAEHRDEIKQGRW